MQEVASSNQSSEPIRRVFSGKEASIGWIRIENSRRLNAMSLTMWRDLLACVEDLEADDDTRVIIVAGVGGKAFCAGGDISEFDSVRSGADATLTYDAVGKAAMNALSGTAKPTIAMIEGYCLGGGLGLALQCDLRIAADNGRFGIPAAKRGIAYSLDGVRQLVDLVGPSQAKHILYSARQFSAADASAMGLVNEVHAQADLLAATRELAETIANNAPLSVRAAKTMVTMATRDPEDRDLGLCAEAEEICLASEDYAEATRSFVEKRLPQFKGR